MVVLTMLVKQKIISQKVEICTSLNVKSNNSNSRPMIKDKYEIDLGKRVIRISTWIAVATALVFIVLFLWQKNATSGLKSENKALDKQNKELTTDITKVREKVSQDSLYILTLQNKADSIINSFDIEKEQHQILKYRYGQLKANYNSASTDDKWDLFTREIDN